MYIEGIGKILGGIESYCKGEIGRNALAARLHEKASVIGVLFEMTGISDLHGECNPGIEPWHILGAIFFIYFLRSNKSLRVRTYDNQLKQDLLGVLPSDGS